MKKMVLGTSMILLFSAAQGHACGQETSAAERAKIANAKLLQQTDVVCNYNGEKTSDVEVVISTPRSRCPKANVTLVIFGEEGLEVQKISVKTIRGIAQYTKRFTIETVETDYPIICQEPVNLKRGK